MKVLYPQDITVDSIHPRHQKVISSFTRLADELDVEIVGRIPERRFKEISGLDLPYRNFFGSKAFSRDITDGDIEDAESFIGVPFRYLATATKRRWGWLDGRELDRKLARYVYAWKEIFSGTDVLFNFMDSLFFINTAELVAERMGVRNIKAVTGRLLKESIMFWDKENMPIRYRQDGDDSVLEMFRERTAGAKEIVRLDSKSGNKIGNMMKKVPFIPRKLSVVLKGGARMDADVPDLPQKYGRLLERSARHLIYPKLHSLFFDRPKEGERYFLFSVHYEWEAQIAYRETFLDQLGTAKRIARCLPHNTYLYVKVHPHWRNADQGLSTVYDLKKERNVRLIRPEENTTELIKGSLGVIAINSTVGYEALLFGKPLIVLGHEAYRKVGIDIKDINRLPRALMDIETGKYRADQQAYDRFLRDYARNIIPLDDEKRLAEEIKAVIGWSMGM